MVWLFLNQLEASDSIRFKELEGLMLSTFHVKDALGEQFVRHLWSYILNATVKSISRSDKDRRIARFTSKKSIIDVLLGPRSEKSQVCKKASYFGCMDRNDGFYNGFDHMGERKPIQTCDWFSYLLTSRACPDKFGHNSFQVQTVLSLGFFAGFCAWSYVSLSLLCATPP